MMTALSFTQSLRDCPSGRLICVKEFAYGSPKFFLSEKTFLNANIMFNSRVSSQKLGATDTALCSPLLNRVKQNLGDSNE